LQFRRDARDALYRLQDLNAKHAKGAKLKARSRTVRFARSAAFSFLLRVVLLRVLGVLGVEFDSAELAPVLRRRLFQDPEWNKGRQPMRTPNSPLFKRYEIMVVLVFAAAFVLMASLNFIF